MLLSELTAADTKMTIENKTQLYNGVLKRLNVNIDSLEAQESHFSEVINRDLATGKLLSDGAFRTVSFRHSVLSRVSDITESNSE